MMVPEVTISRNKRVIRATSPHSGQMMVCLVLLFLLVSLTVACSTLSVRQTHISQNRPDHQSLASD